MIEAPQNSVLIISFSRIGRDPRVLRQLKLVGDSRNVTIMGFNPPPTGFNGKFIALRTDALVDFVEIEGGRHRQRVENLKAMARRLPSLLLLPFGGFNLFYVSRPWAKDAIRELGKLPKFRLIIANEFETLPAIHKAMSGELNLILDVHEYTPDESGGYFRARLLRAYINKWLIPKFANMPKKIFTVSPGIQAMYKSHFSLNMGLLPNATEYKDLVPTRVNPAEIKLVHHGLAAPSRKIEMLFELIRLLPTRYKLYLYLVPGPIPGYLEALVKAAESEPRIIFKDAVPTAQLPDTLNVYDIGVITYDDSSINHRLSLPNKFFEYVQARLGVLIGPSSEMMSFGQSYPFRIVAQTVTARSYADALLELGASQIEELKRQADFASRSLSSEVLSSDFKMELGKGLGL